jgi:signal transduction histidine kinase/CheY-like chemotaxis protein
MLLGALGSLGGMSYLFYRILETRAEDEIRSMLALQTTAIEGQLARAEAATVGLTAALKSQKKLGLKDAEAYKALTFEFFLKRPALVMGVGFGQTPFQLAPDRKWFYPYFYLDQGAPGAIGARLPAPHEGIRYGDMFTEDNYPEQDYYKLPSTAGKAIWLEPYDWYGITMTSFFEPCFGDDRELMGVVVADVNVTALTSQISGPVTRGAGYFAILSEQGNLLAYPPDPEKAKIRLTHEKVADLSAIWPRLNEGSEGMLSANDNLWAYRRIESTRWVMLAAMPRAAVTGPVLRIAVGAALGAGILLAAAVALFVRRLNQRLRPILDQCEAMVEADAQRALQRSAVPGEREGGEEPPPSKHAHTDELGILERSFHHMSQQIHASFAALERANEILEARVEERTAYLKQLNEELLESQKKLEATRESAESANRAKSEFLASMSHELRTPLNGILGYAQILAKSKTMLEPERHGVGIIYNSGSHLLALINDILDLSKIEARKMELYPTEVALRACLNGVVEICGVRAKQKGISFTYHSSADLPQGVRADEKRLRQILLNILGNAIKFTDAGGVTFSVSVLSRNKATESGPTCRLRFQVDDTGPGIAPVHLAKIFTPFEQGAGGAQSREGTGLGLSISQRIAELMGSSIHIESEIGRGTRCFLDLDLPESTTFTGADALPEQTDVTGYEGERRKVLVVDDNAINRSFLTDLLGPLGFRMLEAADGPSGLQKAKELGPDLIITDLAMPGMDGLSLVRHLREAPELARAVILVSSASVFESDRHRSLDAGADDFLAKPVSTGDLLRMLERHLRLTWIRAETPRAQETGDPHAASVDSSYEPLVYPTAETLDRLLELLERGRVDKLLEEARRVEQADAKLAPFIRTVNRLARSFKVKELTELLRAHRQST